MTAEIGSLLASGNTAAVFAWGDNRVVKFYKPAPWAKRVAFREAANQGAVEAFAASYLERYCKVNQCSADELMAWRPYMLAAKLIETPAEAPRLLRLLAVTGS